MYKCPEMRQEMHLELTLPESKTMHLSPAPMCWRHFLPPGNGIPHRVEEDEPDSINSKK